MSDIFASIRNQDEYAMTSLEGVAFVAILQQDGTLLRQTGVDLFFANAQFENIPSGNYTLVAFHPSVNPLEASQNITIKDNEIVQVKFIYLEPERQLLRISVQHYPYDLSTL